MCRIFIRISIIINLVRFINIRISLLIVSFLKSLLRGLLEEYIIKPAIRYS